MRNRSRKYSRGQSQPANSRENLIAENELDPLKAARRQEGFILILLLVFGICQSVLYYQHQQVPNSDFSAFVETSQALLDFKLPGNFKRLPMLGFLQIGLSKLCTGAYPILTAGWLLNAILHTFSVILLYRIGKHFIGRSAFYFAVLAGINPWMLQMTADPIAETTLIFFILLTFDCILKRSWWCYVFAMAASMTRYEGFGLIAVAFLADIFLRNNLKDRIRAFGFAFLAAVPMIVWMGLWRVYKPDTGHYTDHFINTQTRTGFDYWKLLWHTAFGPLLQLPKWVAVMFRTLKIESQDQGQSIQRSAEILEILVRWITGLGFVWAIVYSVIKKNWKFWALFAFWCMYVGLHSFRHKTLDRYTIPAIWMTMLIVFYGFQKAYEFIKEKWTIPRWIVPGLQITLILLAGGWIFMLAPVLPATVPFSKTSVPLVYVSLGVLAVYQAFQWWNGRKRHFLRIITCLLVFGLVLVSNQFLVVQVLGNGSTDAEFKMLAEWYLKHAEPGDKLLTSMPHVVKLFLPEHQEFIGSTTGPEKTIQEFVQKCYQRNVKYVVWDSRLGLVPNDYYYQQWNLQKVAPLGQPRDVGPFRYLEKITVNQRRYLYIFELRPLSEFQKQINQPSSGN